MYVVLVKMDKKRRFRIFLIGLNGLMIFYCFMLLHMALFYDLSLVGLDQKGMELWTIVLLVLAFYSWFLLTTHRLGQLEGKLVLYMDLLWLMGSIAMTFFYGYGV